jgi:NAD(P)H-nitrite reductase large subunit
MKNFSPNLVDEIICPCSGTTRGKIQTLFEEGLDIDAISRRTGAVSGCSGCEWDIMEMLKCLSGQQNANLDQNSSS